MRWTHKHTCIGMLAVAATILTVAAMNPVNTRPNEVSEIDTSKSAEPSSDHGTSDAAPAPSMSRPVITLGDLDSRYIPRPP